MIEIGKFNRKGMIQRRVLTTNAIGEDIQSWTDHKPAWAQILPVSAREIVNGAQTYGDATYIIRFRYIPNLVVTGNDRLVWCGRVFNFIGPPINYQDANQFCEVRAVEVQQESDDSS